VKEDSDLCQMIHAAWPGIMASLESSCALKAFDATQLDVKLAASMLEFIKAAAAACPIFMRDRLAKDFWRGCVKKHRFPCSAQIDLLLIDCLTGCLQSCLFGTEIVLEILQKFGQSDNEAVFKLFEAIWDVESDALWHFLVFEVGALRGAELEASAATHLKSYATPKNCLNVKLSEKFHKRLLHK
jgi:hypothetical protein